MKNISPFHEGEIAVQTQAGVEEKAKMIGHVILDRIRDDAIPFIAQQSMAVLGSCDDKGNLWSSIIFGEPGFIVAEDVHTVCLNKQKSYTALTDPLWQNIENNPQIGMLLIDLASRKRLRINGQLLLKKEHAYYFGVNQCYGNCPKYIQSRQIVDINRAVHNIQSSRQVGQHLNHELQHWISHADTFFVASAHPSQGVDVSHRGGPPGFVKVLNSKRLRIPDFIGNNMFNTLGNFISNPHAGLAFLDFEHGVVLQLTGTPTVFWNESDKKDESAGTSRYWEFEIVQWRKIEMPVTISWQYLGASPFLPNI